MIGVDREKELIEIANTLEKALDGTPEEQQAALKIVKPVLAKIGLSAACGRCAGVCCRRFALMLPLTPEGQPEFTWHTDISPEHLDVIRTHFKLVRQSHIGDGRLVDFDCQSGTRDLYELWFTCTAYDSARNQCSVYDRRPPCCQKYLCPEAMEKDKTPEEWRSSKYARYPALLLEQDERVDQVIDVATMGPEAATRFRMDRFKARESWNERYDEKYPYTPPPEQTDAPAGLSLQLEQSVSGNPADLSDHVQRG